MEIKATIIAHSASSVNGKEIVTFELEYPRFIHSELMTHRLFSRNAASSRAIPVAKMIEAVRSAPACPVHWGKNQPGMQASEELTNPQRTEAVGLWEDAAKEAAYIANKMHQYCGAHKQIVNRILEPFQMMKTVLTATEFDNFFWLRKHSDAQPEIKLLAELMWEELQDSVSILLEPGDWHTPYYGDGYWTPFGGTDVDALGNNLENALAISASCCAQVSYRKLDDSLEKAKNIFAKLIESKPCHASPTEHQATPMNLKFFCFDCQKDGSDWPEGTTHLDFNGDFWSGNFKSWIQHRQLIENNACWKYEEN